MYVVTFKTLKNRVVAALVTQAKAIAATLDTSNLAWFQCFLNDLPASKREAFVRRLHEVVLDEGVPTELLGSPLMICAKAVLAEHMKQKVEAAGVSNVAELLDLADEVVPAKYRACAISIEIGLKGDWDVEFEPGQPRRKHAPLSFDLKQAVVEAIDRFEREACMA